MTTQDETIRALEREAGSSPLARYRWRLALVRAGRGAEAGFEAGDLVRVGPLRPDAAGAVFHAERAAAKLRLHPLLNLLLTEWTGGAEDFPCEHRDTWTLLEPARPADAERAA